MTIDFIKDDNELDFQAENNIDFQEDESPIRLEGQVEEIVEPTTMRKIGSGARDFGKGVVQGLSSLGAGIGMRYGNTWRRKLGMRELTEYEKQNRYAKILGKPVDNTAGKAGKVVGEVLPFLAAPETSIPKLGMWGNLALTGAYQGALGSGASSIAEKGFSKDLGKDTAIGAATGGVINCCINYKWTFQPEGCSKRHVAIKYALVWLGSLLLNSFGTAFVTGSVSELPLLEEWNISKDAVFFVAQLAVSLAVSIKTGISCVAGEDFKLCKTSYPFIRGIVISKIIKSGLNVSTFFNPSTPSVAHSTMVIPITFNNR